MPVKASTTSSIATSSSLPGTILDKLVDMQTVDTTSSPKCSVNDTIKVSDESFEEIRYSALVAKSKTTAETQTAMTSPVVRVYNSNLFNKNLYNESFEETRYSLWLSKNTLASSPKEGSMTTLLQYKDDEVFGKLGVGNGIEMDKEEAHKDSAKMEVDSEFKTPKSEPDSDSGVQMGTERPRPDYVASCTVVIENVRTRADKEERVRAVRKKGEEKVKEKQPVKELGKVEADKKRKTGSSNFSKLVAIECSKSDTAEPKSSDMSGIGNPGSDIVVPLDSQKPNAENDGYVDTNSSKEDNSSGIVGLLEAEAETFSARIADTMVLTGELEALERRKGQNNKDAIEEDVVNVLQGVGEVAELAVMLHEKEGEDNASAADSKKAMEKLDKVGTRGEECTVSFAEGKDMIFLGNIDKKWNNEDIVELLQDIGVKKIDKVKVIPDQENPEHNRGYAFLKIQTVTDAQTAFSLLQKKSIFGSQKIRVEWAKGHERKSDKLMREHASWRQPQRSWCTGSADLGYIQNMVAREHPVSYMLVPCYPDPRWYPHPGTESSFPAVNPRVSPSLGMQSFPYYPLQGSSYPSGLTYEADSYINHSQIIGAQSLWGERKEPREGAMRSERDSNRRESQIGNFAEREVYNGSNRGRDRFNGGRGSQSGGNGREQVEKWKHDLYEEDNKSPIIENEDDYAAKVESLLAS